MIYKIIGALFIVASLALGCLLVYVNVAEKPVILWEDSHDTYFVVGSARIPLFISAGLAVIGILLFIRGNRKKHSGGMNA